MSGDIKKAEYKSVKQELKEKRNEVLDKMSTVKIGMYLTYRHRVFLLASGYPIAFVTFIVLHYR